MTIPGTYQNPTDKPCWTVCFSCSRCADKGRYTKCNKCSGRYDPLGKVDPDHEDYCDCKNGNLRWKTQQGRLIMTKFTTNPFRGQVKYEKQSEDERDWDSYVSDMREKMDNPYFNPIVITED